MVTALPVDLPAGCAYSEAIEILPGFGFQLALDRLLVNRLQIPVTTNASTEWLHKPVQVKTGQYFFYLGPWSYLAYKITARNDLALQQGPVPR